MRPGTWTIVTLVVAGGLDLAPCATCAAAPAPLRAVRIVATLPHRRDAFTQGLVYHGGFLYESVGGYGTSSLRQVDPDTGTVLRERPLPPNQWAEGLTLLHERFHLLTWKAGTAYRFDRATLEPRGTASYTGEGWGLTQDGTHLIMSDGSDRLTWRDPNTLAVVRSIRVRDGGRRVSHLNELESVRGRIYANVWLTDRIAVIDPNSGRVTTWLDLSPLKARHRDADVLNGIAYDPQRDRLWVTGKWWSHLYRIEESR